MKLDIYESKQYFEELIRLVQAAKSSERVVLASMRYEPSEPIVAELTDELIAAARRGVNVELMIDSLSFSLDRKNLPTGPTAFGRPISSSKKPIFRDKYLLLEKLKSNGGKYYVVNMPKRGLSTPFKGRSHIKCAIINDIVFVGGCNFSWTWQFDYMARFKDKKAGDWLHNIVTKAGTNGNVKASLSGKDQAFKIDSTNTLYIDAGTPKQSIIYQNALDFIDNAGSQLVMTCQYFPNTVTAKHLAMAVRRGVDVKLYFNHPHNQAFYERWVHHGVVIAEKMRQPKELFSHELGKYDRRLHAKLLASENGMMLGSHNYVTHGVNFGTAEIALLTKDPSPMKQALIILNKNLK